MSDRTPNPGTDPAPSPGADSTDAHSTDAGSRRPDRDAPTTVAVPALSLVVLVGISSSGKSTFARAHFGATEVVSSDECRGLVADDENDQAATPAAFAVLHAIVDQRLALGRLTVVDANNLRREDRKVLVDLAKRHHVLPVAVVFDLPRWLCERRNDERADRRLPARVLRSQHSLLRGSVTRLEREGFRRVTVLRSDREVAAAVVRRDRLFTDERHRTGPFDVIGDVHGCADELADLLVALGYEPGPDGVPAHPGGRTAVFVGDVVDRGPGVVAALDTVMGMVGAGSALCVAGNHEAKLAKALRGRSVKIGHGLQESLDQLAGLDDDARAGIVRFLDGLVSHVVLDGGNLVVAHAGLPEALHNRSSGAVRSFCLYGDTTGETDAFGLPVRYPWADDYAGRAVVVYGHTPVAEAVWVNNTICVDTGCVFGGRLTALRYPERELVGVPARAQHYAPSPGTPGSPIDATGAAVELGSTDPAPAPAGGPTEVGPGWAIDAGLALGPRRVTTGRFGPVAVHDDQAAAAFEALSRFAADPRLVPYLPPTMAPAPTSSLDAFLEHPEPAFTWFADAGVDEVVAEEKHMGSRAVVLVGRSPDAIAARFGVAVDGSVVTRTGRPFFPEREVVRRDGTTMLTGSIGGLGPRFLAEVQAAVEAVGLFEELASDWVLLDGEVLPWSAKAGDLIRTEYAPVAAAGLAWGAAASAAIGAASARSGPTAAVADEEAAGRAAALDELAGRVARRIDRVTSYGRAYRAYCAPTDGLTGLRFAPFQVLAAEHEVTAFRPHVWHLAVAERLAAAAPDLLQATRSVDVTLADPESRRRATEWWLDLVGTGGEGMVIKPAAGIVGRGRELVQPGLKVRGPEYLRLIYGPEYDDPDTLGALRRRSLGHKRSLALRELALGLEGLERLVRRAPLGRVHECVAAVLALESEPVDPRL